MMRSEDRILVSRRQTIWFVLFLILAYAFVVIYTFIVSTQLLHYIWSIVALKKLVELIYFFNILLRNTESREAGDMKLENYNWNAGNRNYFTSRNTADKNLPGVMELTLISGTNKEKEYRDEQNMQLIHIPKFGSNESDYLEEQNTANKLETDKCSNEDIRLRKKQKKREKKLKKRERIRNKKNAEEAEIKTSVNENVIQKDVSNNCNTKNQREELSNNDHVKNKNKTEEIRKDKVSNNGFESSVSPLVSNSMSTNQVSPLVSNIMSTNQVSKSSNHPNIPPRFLKNLDNLRKQSLMNNFAKKLNNQLINQSTAPTLHSSSVNSTHQTDLNRIPKDNYTCSTKDEYNISKKLINETYSGVCKVIDNFSLFSSQEQDRRMLSKQQPFVAREYSLFGAHECNTYLVWTPTL